MTDNSRDISAEVHELKPLPPPSDQAVEERAEMHGRGWLPETVLEAVKMTKPMKYPTPEAEGHYWAKLKLAENPDHNSSGWEVVQVYDNIPRPWCEADIESGECQFVHVPGIEQSQPVDAFVWGPAVPMPPELSGAA